MKYELTGETKEFFGVTLYRIRYLKSFANVSAGDLGGWLQSTANLSQEGNAQVSDDALVSDDAQVSNDALVSGNAQVSGNALVSGHAQVRGDARVSGNALVSGNAQVRGSARVLGDNSILVVGPIGSRSAYLTVTTDAKLGKRFSTGCFSGSASQLRKAVHDTHGADSLYAKQYYAALVMAETVTKYKGKSNE